MSTLLVFDGLNILRRCYEANPAPESPDKAQSAVSVAIASMYRGLREHSPTHSVAIFDHGGPTWRHALYPDYKANRKPMCAFLAAELGPMWERMAGEGWALMAHPGEEADDTIYGVTEAAIAEGEEVIVSSTDKDLVRLVALGARVYNHFDREWRDSDFCLRSFLVRPEQLTDFLALMGDAVDNIPGVDLVGKKTAARYLAEYGDLRGVLAAAERGDIKGKVGANLVSQKELALLSYELASFRSTFSALDLWWDELEAPGAIRKG